MASTEGSSPETPESAGVARAGAEESAAERPMCPECEQGKHAGCDKWVLDDRDEYVLCACWPTTGPVRHG